MHYYKITDPVEIRIMVLFTLKMAEESISRAQVNHCILSSCDADMFDVCDAIAYLEDVGEIYIYCPGTPNEAVGLTDSGKISADNFGDDLPLLIRETIVSTLRSMYKFARDAKRVTASAVPVNFEEYAADLSLTEEGINLLSMKLFAGSEELAKKICRNYREKYAELYDMIYKMLIADNEDTKE